MSSKFFNLDLEKQTRILNAGIKEFSQKGYDNASTNEIVKEAGISKGLIFHYFKNKKGFYLFLFDYLLEIIMKELYEKIDWNITDILLKYKQITLLKVALLQKYPEIFNFFWSAYLEESQEIKYEIERRNSEIIANSYHKIFKDIDTSRFKDGIDPNKAINIFTWTMEGFAKQYHEKMRGTSIEDLNMDELITEMDLYLETLRQTFYK